MKKVFIFILMFVLSSPPTIVYARPSQRPHVVPHQGAGEQKPLISAPPKAAQRNADLVASRLGMPDGVDSVRFVKRGEAVILYRGRKPIQTYGEATIVGLSDKTVRLITKKEYKEAKRRELSRHAGNIYLKIVWPCCYKHFCEKPFLDDPFKIWAWKTARSEWKRQRP